MSAHCDDYGLGTPGLKGVRFCHKAGAVQVHELVVSLRDQLEVMRLRAEAAEARIASVSGVTREELVKNEREAIAQWLEGTHRTPDGKNCQTRQPPTGTTTAQFGCGNCSKAEAVRARGGR